MRIMLDTNILISAALFPNGRAAQAFFKAVLPPYEPIICDYIVDELRRKFQEKFPDRVTELEAFLFHALSHIDVLPTPEIETADENKLCDPKDRPILRAVLDAHVDLFLTGGNDFLESSVSDPRIISVADFLER